MAINIICRMIQIKACIKKYYILLFILDLAYIIANIIWGNIIHNSKTVDVDKLNTYIYHKQYCDNGKEIDIIEYNYYCKFPDENREYCDLIDKDFECYGILLENSLIIKLDECLPNLDLNQFKRNRTLLENCEFQLFLPITITIFFLLHIIPIIILCLTNCNYINNNLDGYTSMV